LEDLGVDRKVILEWILGKWCGKLWVGCIWLRIGTSEGTCERNKPSGSITFLDFRMTLGFSRKTLVHGVKLFS